jgi:hypothetical protein
MHGPATSTVARMVYLAERMSRIEVLSLMLQTRVISSVEEFVR